MPDTPICRPLGPSGAPAGTSNGKLNDLLDFVRQEAEVLTSEASNIKLQNIEYENHGVSFSFPCEYSVSLFGSMPAHSQLKEMSALRHSFFEMQHEVEASKEQLVI